MTWSRGGLINEMSEALWESVSQTRGKAPAPARKAAEDLARLYEEVNRTGLVGIADQLHRSASDLRPSDVGDILVSYAMGAGGEWDSVVYGAGLRVPTFTAELESRDGQLELTWDGGAEVQNPARKQDVHAANSQDRIILLEDDPVLQAGTTKMLGRIFKGTPVIVSDNVDAAIANIKVHMVGLIVSDVDVIGDKDGIDLFHWVEENRPDLVDRFVFFTGNPKAEFEHYRYLAKGGVLAKDLKEVIFAKRPARDTDRMDAPARPRSPSARPAARPAPAGGRAVRLSRPPDARLSPPPTAAQPCAACGSTAPHDFMSGHLYVKPRTAAPTKTGATRADLRDMKRHEREAAEYDRLLATPGPHAKPDPLPAPGALAADFARDFEAAFRRIDKGHNYVLLYDLRKAMPQYSHEEFTAGVNDMRRQKVLSLDSADGRHVKLTDEQLAGGIFEGDSRLQYAAYRQRLGHAPAAAPARSARREMPIGEFAQAVNAAADGIGDESEVEGEARGRFGDRKVFIAAIWRDLQDDPRFASMSAEEFKRRLLEAHRQRLLTMARADLVAAMDHNEVIGSEIHDRGATFHFVVNEPKQAARRSPARPAPAVTRHVVQRPAPATVVAPVGGVADAVIDAAKKTDADQRNGRGYGRFGSKVFVSAIWRRVQDDPRLGGMTYDQFKRKLVELNRTGALVLARADLIGALDPDEVAESEISDRGATFHFVLNERDGW